MTGRGCQGVAQPFKVEHAGALLGAASSSKQPARSASLFLTYSPAGALLPPRAARADQDRREQVERPSNVAGFSLRSSFRDSRSADIHSQCDMHDITTRFALSCGLSEFPGFNSFDCEQYSPS